MAPQKKVFKKVWKEAEGVVILATCEADARRFPLDSLNADIRRKLELHGLTQKLSDATAKEAGTSVSEKWEAIGEVWAALVSGEWSLKREGAGTLLVRALCEIHPHKSKEAIKEWLDGKSAADRAALERLPAVRTIIDRIRAEKSEGIDAEALLDELA